MTTVRSAFSTLQHARSIKNWLFESAWHMCWSISPVVACTNSVAVFAGATLQFRATGSASIAEIL